MMLEQEKTLITHNWLGCSSVRPPVFIDDELRRPLAARFAIDISDGYSLLYRAWKSRVNRRYRVHRCTSYCDKIIDELI